MTAATAVACCGQDNCACPGCFEDWFCQIRAHIYPDFDGHLCCDGTFDAWMRALVRPLWNLYRCNCGLCEMPREFNPMTACCLAECWIEEYGIPDDCYSDQCWFTDQHQIDIAHRAQLKARVMIEWNGHPDEAFFQRIACLLGIEMEVLAPSLIGSGSDVSTCDILPSWSIKTPEGDPSCAAIVVGRDHSCGTMRHQVAIKITGAPPSIFANACSPIAQPFCFNPYVDAFKCLVGKYKPCHVDVCFWDDYLDNVLPIPVYEDECPCPDGLYRRLPVAGCGSDVDPFRIDWAKLSADDVLAIARKFAALA